MRKSLLRVAVSVAFIGLLFYIMRKDLPHVAQTLRSVNPALVIGGFFTYAASTLLLARRLQLIYGVQDTPVTYAQSLQITYIGFFFNNFLPTAVGGDIVKAYCGSRMTGERLKSFTSVLTDRLLGLFMFVLIPSLTVFFLIDRLDPAVPLTIFAALAVSLGGIAFVFNRNIARRFGFLKWVLSRLKIADKATMLYDGLHHFKHHKKVVLHVLTLSALGQVLSVSTVYFFIRALAADISILYVLLLTPVVNLMSMLPSINGLGVREYGFASLYRSLIGAHEAAALAIVYLFMLFVMSLIGGLIYLVRHDLHFRMREINETPKLNAGEAK